MKTATALILAVAALVGWQNVTSASDYPPAGANIEVAGDLVTGGLVDVTVRNCFRGETIYTRIETLPEVESTCEPDVSSLVDTNGGDLTPRSGLSAFQLQLPDQPGVVDGSARLVDSDEVLEFVLDVTEPDQLERDAVTSDGVSARYLWLIVVALLAAAVTRLLVAWSRAGTLSRLGLMPYAKRVRYQRTADSVWRVMSDRAIVRSVTTTKSSELVGLAAMVWVAVDEPRTASEVSDELGVDEDVVMENLVALIDDGWVVEVRA